MIKTSQNGYIITNFLVLHFGENIMKIRTKIPKLQMHKKLPINVNEKGFIHIFKQFFMNFYGGQLKQQTCYCNSFTLLISYMGFNLFKMAVQFFQTASSFPNFEGPNAFFPDLKRPLVRLQKGRKLCGTKWVIGFANIEVLKTASQNLNMNILSP